MTALRFSTLVCLLGAIGLWAFGPAGRLAVVSFLVLFGPGFLLERMLPVRLETPFARPALWLGLSVSMVALVYQWATAFGFALSGVALGAGALVVAVAVVVALWRTAAFQVNMPAFAALLAVFAATFALRLYQIRALVLPAWVDSVHHALLIRVAIERGQAPINLYPYLPITQLPYHWGYHVVAAASAQLAGVTVPQVMLWQGQGLNALHVLACAALASYIWRKPWAGVVAGVVVGLVSLMPAFYASWGRYTQLTGLLLLPPLAVVWQELLQSAKRKAQSVKLSFFASHFSLLVHAAVLLAGLNLVHFRVLLFGLCLLAVQTLVWLVNQKPRWAVRGLVACFAAGLGGMLLTAPWLWLLAQQRLAPVVEQPQLLASGGSYTALSPGLLWAGENRLLVALALVGGLLGLRWRVRGALVMLLWVGGLAVMANPQLALYLLPAAAVPLGLWALQSTRPWLALLAVPLLLANPLLLRVPSSWLITNDVVTISLFMPVSALIGGFAVAVERLVLHLRNVHVFDERRMTKAESQHSLLSSFVVRLLPAAASAACLVAVAGWGAWSQRDVINPNTVLANQADLAAIEWAAQYTPADARFLIGATGWLPTAERGTDGGWWLLPLAGRWTSTPPVIFDYGPRDFAKSVRERTRQIAQFKPGQEQTLEAIIERDQISFIYIRDGVGPLSRAAFSDTQRYMPVYERDGVTILAVAART